MTAPDLLEKTLKERLRGDPDLTKLAAALGVKVDALIAMVVQLSVHPETPPEPLAFKSVGGRPPVSSVEFAKLVKQALADAQAAEPQAFSDVRKQQLAITQPGDPRAPDPALKAELSKLLKGVRGGGTS